MRNHLSCPISSKPFLEVNAILSQSRGRGRGRGRGQGWGCGHDHGRHP